MTKKYNPFKAAKRILSLYGPNKNPYAYFTLQAAFYHITVHGGRKKKPANLKAITHFKEMIAPCNSERVWLCKALPQKDFQPGENIQFWRHRWLDQLIKEWNQGKIK